MYVESLVILILFALFVLELQLCLCLVYGQPVCSRCRIVIVFHGFLLVCVFLLFMFGESWELVGKEEA